jgi:hypothetical protein
MGIVQRHPWLRPIFEPMETALLAINKRPDDIGEEYHKLLTESVMSRLMAQHYANNPNMSPADIRKGHKWENRTIRAAGRYWSYKFKNPVSELLGKAKQAVGTFGTVGPQLYKTAKTDRQWSKVAERAWDAAKAAPLSPADFMSGVKYTQIPGAVIMHGLERIPVSGLAQSIVPVYSQYKAAKASGNWARQLEARQEIEKVWAKQATGVAGIGLGMLGYALGMIEEEFSDNPAVAQTQKETGHKPFAFNIGKLVRHFENLGSIPATLMEKDKRAQDGDFLADIQLVQPAGVLLAVGSAAMHALMAADTNPDVKKATGWDKWAGGTWRTGSKVFAAAADTALDQLFGQRYFTDLVNAIAYAPNKEIGSIAWRYISTALESAPTQLTLGFGSSIMSKTETVVDPWVRESRSERVTGRKVESGWDEVKELIRTSTPIVGTYNRSHIPWLSSHALPGAEHIPGAKFFHLDKELPIALDAWGQKRQTVSGTADLPLAARIGNAVSPVQLTRVHEQPVQREAIRLATAPGNTALRENETQEDRRKRTEIRGEILLREGNRIVGGPGWSKMSEKQQRDALKNLYRWAGKTAAEKMGKPLSEQQEEEEQAGHPSQ